jgi:4-amino-4-deoxy-L-arabinose transferase-like glycosyltransferase
MVSFGLFSRNKQILIVIYVIIYLLFYNHSYLYDQDEAAYAGFSKTMLESSDWIIMDFPFSEPHRKPPLHFWITAIAFKVFGEGEFTLRIFPALWIFLICILTYSFCKKIYDKRTAFWAFCILSLCLYFPLNGKIALVDGLLTFLEFCAFYLLYLHFFEEKKYSRYLFWIVLSLGALTKGPPIYIFTMGILFFAFLKKDLRPKVISLHPWFFLPLSLLPLFIWGYLAWKKTNGELILWMLDWYILRRATNPVFGQQGPPGTYLLLFFIGLFPWSLFLPSVFKELYLQIKGIFRNYKTGITLESLDFFLLSSLLSGWVIYEFMMSKLPSYVLITYPILAIMIARNLEKNYQQNQIKIKIVIIVSLVLTIVIQTLLLIFNEKRSDTFTFAKLIQENLQENEIIYFEKDYGLPSLAYYLNYPKQKIKVLNGIQEVKNLEEGKLLILDESSFYILQYVKKLEVKDKKKLFLYDRNRHLELIIVRLK